MEPHRPPVRLALSGLGFVNRGLLSILQERSSQLHREYDFTGRVVAVADSSGVAILNDGYAPDVLLNLRSAGKKVRDLEGYRPGLTTADMPLHAEADFLIEASPGNIKDGQPGLDACRNALKRKWKIVLANKTPLLFGFDELTSIRNSVAYSATVCGGLPVINVLQRDLKLARIRQIRGIFNATSNFVLQELAAGRSMREAVLEAQRIGAAEADPSHDLEGHDTANKLFIIMKSLGWAVSIHDIPTTGITQITNKEIQEATSRGGAIKLVAEANQVENIWQLTVRPQEIPSTSFLGSCNGWEMGIEIASDLYEKVYLKNYEADPAGTCAAVLRDIVDLTNR